MTRSKETEPSRPREVKIRGKPIRVADDQPTFWDRLEAGTWEPGTLAAIGRFVDARTTFLDLGAWVGPTSLYAASLDAKVIALEADPAALDQLRRNLAVNPALAKRITVVPRAIHAERGSLTLGAQRKPGDSMSSALQPKPVVTWEVDTIAPSELLQMVGGRDRLFVKMDIEGGEYALLPAMTPLIDRQGCAVLVSFHPALLAGVVPERAAQVMATKRALEVLARFAAHTMEEGALVARDPDPVAIASRVAPDEWLFIRAW